MSTGPEPNALQLPPEGRVPSAADIVIAQRPPSDAALRASCSARAILAMCAVETRRSSGGG